jgi:hypothetical protein
MTLAVNKLSASLSGMPALRKMVPDMGHYVILVFDEQHDQLK